MSVGVLNSSDRSDEGSVGRRLLVPGALFLRSSPRGARGVGAVIWLVFIVFPLANAIGKDAPLFEHGLVIGGAVLFVAAYMAMVMTCRFEARSRLSLALFAVLLSVASALTLGQDPSWGFLFTYCAACAAFVVPSGVGLQAVVVCATLAGLTSAIGGADGGSIVSFVAASAGIGFMMVVMGDLRLRNIELRHARAELARMAVTEERERFARDLHDLLGHSLSVITLKAELAGRMLADRPTEAAREVAELEQVARTALGEVREAVSGYRRPTLEGELAGARMALSAAGIEADVQEARVPLDPDVEAVLAWTVREGATNVIRHSGATHCTVRVTASLTDAAVEVIDDGLGAGVPVDHGGRGVGVNGDLNGGGRHGHAHPIGSAQGGVNGGGQAHAAGTAQGGANGDGHGNATGTPQGGANGTATRRVARAGPGERAAGGNGISGLAERARLVNGTLEAGAGEDGGYRLAVSIPVSRA